jgi:5'-nucleotidase
VDARGRTYFWVGFKRIFTDPERGTDLHAIAEGCISVTPLHMDLTEHRERQRLSEHLEGSLAALARGTKRPSDSAAKPRRKSSGRARRAAKG